MNIIQKFIEDFFHIDSNTSATIIITIIVFTLGYIFTSIGSGIKNYSLRKSNRRLFLRTLESLIDSLRKRSEALDEQLGHLQPEIFNSIPITKIQFFQANIFSSMTHKEAFECFFQGLENNFKCNKKTRYKAFVKVWENMANIEFWENQMYEQMLPTQKEINRLNETMGKPLEDMRILYTELLVQVNNPAISMGEKLFLSELKKVVDTWASQDNRSHGHIVNEFLSKKLNELCNKHHSIPAARKLRDHCMSASYWHGNILVVVESLNRELKSYHHSLSYFSRSTRVIIKILS